MTDYQENYQNAINGMMGRANRYNEQLSNWRSDVDATKERNSASINAAKSQEQMQEIVDGAQDIGMIATAEGLKKGYSKYVYKQGQQPYGALDKEEHGGYDFDKSSTFGKKYWKKKEGSSTNAVEEGGEADTTEGTGVLSRVGNLADDVAESDLVPTSVKTIAKGVSKATDVVGDALGDLMGGGDATLVPTHTPVLEPTGGGGGEVELTGKSLSRGPFVDKGIGTGLNLDKQKADWDAETQRLESTQNISSNTSGDMADYSTAYTPPEPTIARLPPKTGGGTNLSQDALQNSHGGVITQTKEPTPTVEGEGSTTTSMADTAGEGGGIFSLTEVPEQTSTDVASDITTTATEGADEEVGEGLDVAGAALEATGVFAWLGALLQVGATGVEAYGAYSLGKGIYDDATGKDDGSDAKQEALPKRPQAEAPMSIISNTALHQSSFAGSW